LAERARDPENVLPGPGLRAILIVTLIAAVALLSARSAQAAFPAANGKLAIAECLACEGPPSRIWTMNPDGSDRVQILGDLHYDPVFSGNGERIAFTLRDGKGAIANTVNVYTANPDGTDVQQVTDNPVSSFDPDLSRDGSRIVFTSPRTFENGALNYDIYVANADGSGVTRLTTAPGDDVTPAFSPDDQRIVFSSQRDGGDFEIYSMNADGSGQTRLTETAGVDDEPEYSPDGSTIAFRTRRAADQSDLYAMAADGSNERPLVADANASEIRGVYSPDGASFAYSAAPITDGPPQVFDVFVADSAGAGGANVTNTADVSERHVDWQPLPERVVKRCETAYPNLRGGGPEADTIKGGDVGDAILGKGESDKLKGAGGDDCVFGGGSDDTVRGNSGSDDLFGGGGDDVIRSGGGKDRVDCGAGEDRAVVDAKDKVAKDCEDVVVKGKKA
jgi:TolB protein